MCLIFSLTITKLKNKKASDLLIKHVTHLYEGELALTKENCLALSQTWAEYWDWLAKHYLSARSYELYMANIGLAMRAFRKHRNAETLNRRRAFVFSQLIGKSWAEIRRMT